MKSTMRYTIRFYAWSAYVFSEDSFIGTVNGRYDVRERFGWLDRELRSRLMEPANLTDWIRVTEELLLKKIETAREKVVVDRVMHDILRHQGGLGIDQLSKCTDPEICREMWYDGLANHFFGPDDPNFCVIRFTTQRYSLFIDWEVVKGEIDE